MDPAGWERCRLWPRPATDASAVRATDGRQRLAMAFPAALLLAVSAAGG